MDETNKEYLYEFIRRIETRLDEIEVKIKGLDAQLDILSKAISEIGCRNRILEDQVRLIRKQ